MEKKLLTLLRQISEIIAGSDDYQTVLATVVEVLSRNLKVDVCSVYVYDEGKNELILAATEGLRQQAVGNVKMKPGVGLTGESFKQREILNLIDPEQHPRFVFFKNTGEEKYKSFLSVPLNVAGRSVGMIVLQRITNERFSAAEIDVVNSLGPQLANLILNAQMLKALAADGDGAKTRPGDRRHLEQTMLRGVAANDGLARGQTSIFKSVDHFHDVQPDSHADVDAEVALLERAIDLTKRNTVELERRALEMISEADAAIFNVHLMFLEDKAFINEIKKEIVERGHTAEYGLKRIFSLYGNRFAAMSAQVFREKEMDFKDVMSRLLETVRNLRSGVIRETAQNVEGRDLILVTRELLPSDLMRLPIDGVAGIVCEKGGVTAHVAILAKALDIPALMGVKGACAAARDGDEAILDCHAELVYFRPVEQVKHQFKQMMEAGEELEKSADPNPALTTDDVEIALRANISLICEAALLERYGADGVGLYRTEFLYMIRDALPTEEAQYNVYSKILKEAGGRNVSIRVLDAGGDKPLPYLPVAQEENPALGNRGIRLLLERQDIFKTQLRAILRAGVHGPLTIMFPMVSGANELFNVLRVVSEVERELHARNVEHAENYRTGVMAEIPSAVFGLESIVKQVDMISVGSNDLVQYVFAADRGNELVADCYQPLHPTFLEVLRRIGEVMKSYPSKDLALCGEMAGNPLAVPFLIGAGIRELSMAPRQIPLIKSVIRSFSVAECEEILKRALSLKNPEAVVYLVKESLEDKGLGG